MDLGIAGKTALVTASSGGLGEACARALAAEGANLALMARSAGRLAVKAREIAAAHGVRALALPGDMRVKADVERVVGELAATLGPPDILVLNSGRPPNPMREVLEEDDDARWEDAYRTQLWGGILVTRKIAPLMATRGWGRIVAVTSASVKQPMTRHGLSTVFRAGITGFMKHLANEIAAKGVTVNTVCPASIATEALQGSYDIAERARRIPVGRIGTPEELAAAVVFLCSRQAGFITGASLHVDGGMVASLY